VAVGSINTIQLLAGEVVVVLVFTYLATLSSKVELTLTVRLQRQFLMQEAEVEELLLCLH
jgi:hypothetical protein